MKITIIKHCLILLPVLLFHSFSTLGQKSIDTPKLIIPFGHQLGIKHTFFSHDNRWLITADEEMTIVSDVRSGKPLSYLPGSRPAISPKSEYIATIQDTNVVIWNTATGNQWKVLHIQNKVEQIAFRPGQQLQLLVTTLHEGPIRQDEPQRRIAIWDISTAGVLHSFVDVSSKSASALGHCTDGSGNDYPLYGGWFTTTGDSVRLIYRNAIHTWPVGSYHQPAVTCLKSFRSSYRNARIKILNNHTVKVFDEGSVSCFDEYGNLACSWSTDGNGGEGMQQLSEVISPAYNYQALFAGKRITLRSMKDSTVKFFMVNGALVKKMTFNQAGTHVLVEFLNEAPRILLADGFATPGKALSDRDNVGFPEYVYKTSTMPDASDVTAVFDSVTTRVPKAFKVAGKIGKFVRVPDLTGGASNIMDDFKQNINSSFTNSGEVINLATNRTISKIQSLIKFSGDIQLSPDKSVMLLNTGKIISLYSLREAKILINLTGKGASCAFSPDSRWLVQYLQGRKVNLVKVSDGSITSIPFALMPVMYNALYFTPDSRQVVVSCGNEGYGIINIDQGKLLKVVTKQSYSAAASGDKYALVDVDKKTLQIFRTSDSTKLSELSLEVKPTKEDKKKQQTASMPFTDYRVCFSQGSDAVIVWNPGRLIYLKDVVKLPKDTMMVRSEADAPLTNVAISHNGRYLTAQYRSDMVILFNTATKAGALLSEGRQGMEDGMGMDQTGTMFRKLMSGNSLDLLGGKEQVQFSTSGDSVLLCQGDSTVLYATATQQRLKAFKADGEIKYFNLRQNLAIAYHYGQLKYYYLDSAKEWFSMIPFNNGETVFLLPKGTYFGRKVATRYLGYMQDARSLSYKQFDYNNNQPGEVLRALGNNDRKYLALYDSTLAIRRRREGVGASRSARFDEAPEVVIDNEKQIMGEVKKKELLLKLKMKGRKANLDKLAIYINGNPITVEGPAGNTLPRRNAHETNVKLILAEGNNNIEVSVFDTDGVESYRQPLYVQYTPDTPTIQRLYFVGIAVSNYQNESKNLEFAKKDILNVLDSLTKHFKGQLIVDTLFDKKVTKDGVGKLRAKLTNSRPSDIVLVYYSGHGQIDISKAEAFFGTWNMDFDHPSVNGLSIKHFNDLVENIPARNKVIFLDACHSGEIDSNAWKGVVVPKPVRQPSSLATATSDAALDNLSKGDPLDVPFKAETAPFDIVLDMYTDLYQGNGTTIVTAARGLEIAKEYRTAKLGLFTYTWLTGVTDLSADEDTNAVLTIGELQNYVVTNTPVFFKQLIDSNSVQRASARKENEFNDWPLLRKGNAALIKHSEIRPTNDNRPWSETFTDTRAELIGAKKDFKTIVDGHASWEDRGKSAMNLARKIVGKVVAFFKGDEKRLEQYMAKGSHPAAIILADEPTFHIQYEIVKDKAIFQLRCPNLVPFLLVDVNGNNKSDSCVDRLYTRMGNLQEVCLQHIKGVGITSDCNDETVCGKKQRSNAIMKVGGDWCYFMIPVEELNAGAQEAKMAFVFLASGTSDWVGFPQGAGGKEMFAATLPINLKAP